MKDFFFTLLNKLDKLCGLRQLEKIYASHEKKEDAKKEINDLLDILCRVSNQFSYIPAQDQQRIISDNVISDQEFIGLNAKIIFKWLSKSCGAYYKEAVEEIKLPPGVMVYEPLTGDERQKWIDAWNESLKLFQEAVKPVELGGARMKSSLEELPVLEGYKKPDHEAILRSELHTQYIRENYEPLSGKKKEGWVSEEEWLIKNKL
jgi:hypothetical protein